MTDPPAPTLTSVKRRRLIGLGLLRSLATTTVLVALYYLLPLNHLASVPLAVILVAGLSVLLVVAAWQLRLVSNARYPGVRAVQALATTVPLFVLLFASAYFVMARSSPPGFSYQLTRTDSLYFTVTTFSTVGFGDIAATSQTGRLVVTIQIILDLLILGLGIRVFIGAVQRAQQARPDTTDPGTSPTEHGSDPDSP